MSTIAIAPTVRVAAPATRLRLTARGRRVLAVLASLPAVIALTIAMLSSGGAVASGQEGAPADSFATVTVMPGDSLWSIAQDVAPGADPRDVVWEIMQLNGLSAEQLVAGHSLAIPRAYAAQG